MNSGEFPPQLLTGGSAWQQAGIRDPLEIWDVDFSVHRFPDDVMKDYRFTQAISFRNCTFPSDFQISNCVFENNLDFTACNFQGRTTVKNIRVDGSLNLGSVISVGIFSISNSSINYTLIVQNATFDALDVALSAECTPDLLSERVHIKKKSFINGELKAVHFQDARLDEGADFRITTAHEADFSDAHLGRNSSFASCNFRGGVSFSRALFGGAVSFENTTFEFGCWFEDTRFNDRVDFSSADETVMPRCNFAGASFAKECHFDNRRFAGRTDFSRVRFRTAPSFHNCAFFTGTSFNEASFEDVTSLEAESSYRALRKGSADIENFHDEMQFFRLEMKARMVREPNGAVKALYRLYEQVADYGRSVYRPLLWFSVLQLGCFGIYAVISAADVFLVSGEAPVLSPTKAVHLGSFSLAQGLPFIPAVKDAVPKAPETLWMSPGAHVVSQAVAVLQGLVSIALLFLVVLGLRNLFRLK